MTAYSAGVVVTKDVFTCAFCAILWDSIACEGATNSRRRSMCRSSAVEIKPVSQRVAVIDIQ